MIAPFYYPGLPLGEQCSKARAELLSTSFRDSERKVREQFTDMFSASGFDARRDIAGIILNHHFIVPQPGFECGKDGKPAPKDILRTAPFGRIAFAHTDLTSGNGHHLSIEEGHRPALQLLSAL